MNPTHPLKMVRKEIRKEICCLCREPGRVVERTDDGPVCHRCYSLRQYYNPWKHEFCIGCNQHKAIARRTSDGSPVCSSCISKIREFDEKCFFCDEVKPVKRRSSFGKKAICAECVSAGYGPRRKTGVRILRIPKITPLKLEFRRRVA
jgi:hypothetical protein